MYKLNLLFCVEMPFILRASSNFIGKESYIPEIWLENFKIDLKIKSEIFDSNIGFISLDSKFIQVDKARPFCKISLFPDQKVAGALWFESPKFIWT